MSQKNFFVHVFGGVWKVWDILCRTVINLVITLLVLILLIGSVSSHRVAIPSSTALVVDIQGDLVEQYSGDPAQRALDRLLGQKDRHPQTRMRDVIEAIEHARDDKRIKALVLETDGMGHASLSDLEDVTRAIHGFKKSGKPVFSLGSAYDQGQYFLAAQADTVFIHPQGDVFLQGYSIYEPYFKEALDKYGVEWNIFRVGKYKSAVEPFMLNGMSKEARENYTQLLGELWTDYQKRVTTARRLPADAIKDYVANVGRGLTAVGGDGAKLALDARLVDKIAEPDQMQAAVSKVVGQTDHNFTQIGFLDYLDIPDGVAPMSRNQVAVVVAQGDIMVGDQPPGSIGGDSTSELIREARYDDAVKAVVLRVDSPGGSSFASDLILRELELTKEAGKPVVVSMGGVAASGGYWISMSGDEIYASPDTITGSIGIFGMLPTFQGTLAKVGVHTDGVGTTPFSDAFDVTRPMTPELRQAFQLSTEYGYHQFITKVAAHRHMKVNAVDDIAQGRVWAGQDAKRLGLIDSLGDLQDAEAAAAKMAGLGNDYATTYIEKGLSFTDRFLMGLAQNSDASKLTLPQASTPNWFGRLADVAKSLEVFDDPRGQYAFCFCEVR